LARGKAKDTTARASAAEDRIRVELVRLMLREAALKPFQSQRKIFVIFHAETMMDTAQNAFLKVLEDPPAHSYFVLVCDNLRELLPTIRSRCQKLLVPPLPPEDLVPALQAGGLAPDVARAIALLAAGSVTRARQLSGADIAVLQSRAIAFMRSAATCDALELPERTKELADTGDLPSDTGLELLSILVRDVATYRGSESADDLTYSAYTDTLRRLIAAYPDANFDEAVCHIDSAAVGIERNLSVDWVYYNLAIQLNRALGARVVVQRT
jgi:DNA polymerase-3 subunit delta'